MPNIKLKSIEYMEAAQELINKRIYNASVHCSYYSRLMQMKYILAHHKRPIDYNTQNEKREKGSHEYIITEISNRISNRSQSLRIVQCFRALKSLRMDADYKDVLLKADDSTLAKQMSEGLKQKLNAQFGNIYEDNKETH